MHIQINSRFSFPYKQRNESQRQRTKIKKIDTIITKKYIPWTTKCRVINCSMGATVRNCDTHCTYMYIKTKRIVWLILSTLETRIEIVDLASVILNTHYLKKNSHCRTVINSQNRIKTSIGIFNYGIQGEELRSK